MLSEILSIPEIQGLDSCGAQIRIAPDHDVPLTPRVRAIIDTAAFRRLARISQLGLVSLVYPAAQHTRFEHSLGVYRLALLLLKRLAHEPRFAAVVSRGDAELLIVASLLHDIGHWPFCHPIEDIRLPNIPRHESSAKLFLADREMADILRKQWKIRPQDLVALLNKGKTPKEYLFEMNAWSLLSSILAGPVDIDKMDYLYRDSLHAGVPYGRHFDLNRLVRSLTVNDAADGLAITEKGKTAAELLVFARYVMFSEVYWHKSVRCATAMLQRAFFILCDRRENGDGFNLEACFHSTEREMIDAMLAAARETEALPLLDGLFGKRRRLYKRVVEYSIVQQPEIYAMLAGKPYPWLCGVAARLAGAILPHLAVPPKSPPPILLLDAPPIEREVEFRIDVHYPKEGVYRLLGDVSPVVRTLAHDQFDDHVKRVRIFVPPEHAETIRKLKNLPELVGDAVADLKKNKERSGARDEARQVEAC